VMQDAQAAKQLAAQMETLVELGKVAVAAMPIEEDKLSKEASASILETMQITATDSEVHFQLDVFVPSIADEPMNTFHSMASWININAGAFSGRTPRQKGSPYTGHRVLHANTVAANGSSSWSDSFNAERLL